MGTFVGKRFVLGMSEASFSLLIDIMLACAGLVMTGGVRCLGRAWARRTGCCGLFTKGCMRHNRLLHNIPMKEQAQRLFCTAQRHALQGRHTATNRDASMAQHYMKYGDREFCVGLENGLMAAELHQRGCAA